jgi:hypothetical protein
MQAVCGFCYGRNEIIAGSRGFYSTLASRRSVPDDLRIDRIGMACKPTACRYVEACPDLI